MTGYSLLRGATSGRIVESHVRRDADGAIIPADPANADWREYQEWLADGNAPSPALAHGQSPIPVETNARR
ncbi:hypothetical protein [Methylocystis sp. S23]